VTQTLSSAPPRRIIRIGRPHVIVVIASPALRSQVVEWLRGRRRARVVRAVASEAELGPGRPDCDLVVASALEGTRELRALGRRFAGRAGLVALDLGTAPLPTGWSGIPPGAPAARALDRAIMHPERAVFATWSAISAVAAALAAVLLAPLYVPASAVSFERAALAYAARFPEAAAWWHVWGAGAPLLIAPGWPLLRLAAQLGGGGEVFVLLAAALGAALAVALLLVALRAGAGRWALAATLAALAGPALWVWPRGGDVTSLAGLGALMLVFATGASGRQRVLVTAPPVALAALGGYAWLAAAVVAALVSGARARRLRAALAGALLGVALSSAVALPPLLVRGPGALLSPLARPLAASDLAPLVAVAATLAAIAWLTRRRRALAAAALAALVAGNALALAVPLAAADAPPVPSTGAFGRLAVLPAQALALAARSPDLPTTGADVPAELMTGGLERTVSNARLEWAGADRALLPDRSSAVVFNERDWGVIDRERLLLAAPRVRPILTAGITPTVLVVAEATDAAVFAEALVRLGASSDRLIPVRGQALLDEIDRDTLREFTLVLVYGRPWRDIARAEAVLSDYLALSGFVLMDAAGLAGPQPLMPEARTVPAGRDDVAVVGDERLIAARGFDGRVVAMDRFDLGGDAQWEEAALVAGNKRVIQFGSTGVAGDVGVSAHMVWSGADLPRRAAAGEPQAIAQLHSALSWMLTAAEIPPADDYARPAGGDVLEDAAATSRFISPEHWRIELHLASTGVLFKERHDERWRAYQMERSAVTGQESRTPLAIRPTAQGYMYVTLPPNARIVDFVFEPHPFEPAARGISLLALFALVGLAVLARRRA